MFFKSKKFWSVLKVLVIFFSFFCFFLFSHWEFDSFSDISKVSVVAGGEHSLLNRLVLFNLHITNRFLEFLGFAKIKITTGALFAENILTSSFIFSFIFRANMPFYLFCLVSAVFVRRIRSRRLFFLKGCLRRNRSLLRSDGFFVYDRGSSRIFNKSLVCYTGAVGKYSFLSHSSSLAFNTLPSWLSFDVNQSIDFLKRFDYLGFRSFYLERYESLRHYPVELAWWKKKKLDTNLNYFLELREGMVVVKDEKPAKPKAKKTFFWPEDLLWYVTLVLSYNYLSKVLNIRINFLENLFDFWQFRFPFNFYCYKHPFSNKNLETESEISTLFFNLASCRGLGFFVQGRFNVKNIEFKYLSWRRSAIVFKLKGCFRFFFEILDFGVFCFLDIFSLLCFRNNTPVVYFVLDLFYFLGGFAYFLSDATHFAKIFKFIGLFFKKVSYMFSSTFLWFSEPKNTDNSADEVIFLENFFCKVAESQISHYLKFMEVVKLGRKGFVSSVLSPYIYETSISVKGSPVLALSTLKIVYCAVSKLFKYFVEKISNIFTLYYLVGFDSVIASSQVLLSYFRLFLSSTYFVFSLNLVLLRLFWKRASLLKPAFSVFSIIGIRLVNRFAAYLGIFYVYFLGISYFIFIILTDPVIIFYKYLTYHTATVAKPRSLFLVNTAHIFSTILLSFTSFFLSIRFILLSLISLVVTRFGAPLRILLRAFLLLSSVAKSLIMLILFDGAAAISYTLRLFRLGTIFLYVRRNLFILMFLLYFSNLDNVSSLYSYFSTFDTFFLKTGSGNFFDFFFYIRTVAHSPLILSSVTLLIIFELGSNYFSVSVARRLMYSTYFLVLFSILLAYWFLPDLGFLNIFFFKFNGFFIFSLFLFRSLREDQRFFNNISIDPFKYRGDSRTFSVPKFVSVIFKFWGSTFNDFLEFFYFFFLCYVFYFFTFDSCGFLEKSILLFIPNLSIFFKFFVLVFLLVRQSTYSYFLWFFLIIYLISWSIIAMFLFSNSLFSYFGTILDSQFSETSAISSLGLLSSVYGLEQTILPNGESLFAFYFGESFSNALAGSDSFLKFDKLQFANTPFSSAGDMYILPTFVTPHDDHNWAIVNSLEKAYFNQVRLVKSSSDSTLPGYSQYWSVDRYSYSFFGEFVEKDLYYGWSNSVLLDTQTYFDYSPYALTNILGDSFLRVLVTDVFTAFVGPVELDESRLLNLRDWGASYSPGSTTNRVSGGESSGLENNNSLNFEQRIRENGESHHEWFPGLYVLDGRLDSKFFLFFLRFFLVMVIPFIFLSFFFAILGKPSNNFDETFGEMEFTNFNFYFFGNEQVETFTTYFWNPTYGVNFEWPADGYSNDPVPYEPTNNLFEDLFRSVQSGLFNFTILDSFFFLPILKHTEGFSSNSYKDFVMPLIFPTASDSKSARIVDFSNFYNNIKKVGESGSTSSGINGVSRNRNFDARRSKNFSFKTRKRAIKKPRRKRLKKRRTIAWKKQRRLRRLMKLLGLQPKRKKRRRKKRKRSRFRYRRSGISISSGLGFLKKNKKNYINRFWGRPDYRKNQGIFIQNNLFFNERSVYYPEKKLQNSFLLDSYTSLVGPSSGFSISKVRSNSYEKFDFPRLNKNYFFENQSAQNKVLLNTASFDIKNRLFSEFLSNFIYRRNGLDRLPGAFDNLRDNNTVSAAQIATAMPVRYKDSSKHVAKMRRVRPPGLSIAVKPTPPLDFNSYANSLKKNNSKFRFFSRILEKYENSFLFGSVFLSNLKSNFAVSSTKFVYDFCVHGSVNFSQRGNQSVYRFFENTLKISPTPSRYAWFFYLLVSVSGLGFYKRCVKNTSSFPVLGYKVSFFLGRVARTVNTCAIASPLGKNNISKYHIPGHVNGVRPLVPRLLLYFFFLKIKKYKCYFSRVCYSVGLFFKTDHFNKLLRCSDRMLVRLTGTQDSSVRGVRAKELFYIPSCWQLTVFLRFFGLGTFDAQFLFLLLYLRKYVSFMTLSDSFKNFSFINYGVGSVFLIISFSKIWNSIKVTILNTLTLANKQVFLQTQGTPVIGEKYTLKTERILNFFKILGFFLFYFFYFLVYICYFFVSNFANNFIKFFMYTARFLTFYNFIDCFSYRKILSFNRFLGILINRGASGAYLIYNIPNVKSQYLILHSRLVFQFLENKLRCTYRYIFVDSVEFLFVIIKEIFRFLCWLSFSDFFVRSTQFLTPGRFFFLFFFYNLSHTVLASKVFNVRFDHMMFSHFFTNVIHPESAVLQATARLHYPIVLPSAPICYKFLQFCVVGPKKNSSGFGLLGASKDRSETFHLPTTLFFLNSAILHVGTKTLPNTNSKGRFKFQTLAKSFKLSFGAAILSNKIFSSFYFKPGLLSDATVQNRQIAYENFRFSFKGLLPNCEKKYKNISNTLYLWNTTAPNRTYKRFGWVPSKVRARVLSKIFKSKYWPLRKKRRFKKKVYLRGQKTVFRKKLIEFENHKEDSEDSEESEDEIWDILWRMRFKKKKKKKVKPPLILQKPVYLYETLVEDQWSVPSLNRIPVKFFFGGNLGKKTSEVSLDSYLKNSGLNSLLANEVAYELNFEYSTTFESLIYELLSPDGNRNRSLEYEFEDTNPDYSTITEFADPDKNFAESELFEQDTILDDPRSFEFTEDTDRGWLFRKATAHRLNFIKFKRLYKAETTEISDDTERVETSKDNGLHVPFENLNEYLRVGVPNAISQSHSRNTFNKLESLRDVVINQSIRDRNISWLDSIHEGQYMQRRSVVSDNSSYLLKLAAVTSQRLRNSAILSILKKKLLSAGGYYSKQIAVIRDAPRFDFLEKRSNFFFKFYQSFVYLLFSKNFNITYKPATKVFVVESLRSLKLLGAGSSFDVLGFYPLPIKRQLNFRLNGADFSAKKVKFSSILNYFLLRTGKYFLNRLYFSLGSISTYNRYVVFKKKITICGTGVSKQLPKKFYSSIARSARFIFFCLDVSQNISSYFNKPRLVAAQLSNNFGVRFRGSSLRWSRSFFITSIANFNFYFSRVCKKFKKKITSVFQYKNHRFFSFFLYRRSVSKVRVFVPRFVTQHKRSGLGIFIDKLMLSASNIRVPVFKFFKKLKSSPRQIPFFYGASLNTQWPVLFETANRRFFLKKKSSSGLLFKFLRLVDLLTTILKYPNSGPSAIILLTYGNHFNILYSIMTAIGGFRNSKIIYYFFLVRSKLARGSVLLISDEFSKISIDLDNLLSLYCKITLVDVLLTFLTYICNTSVSTAFGDVRAKVLSFFLFFYLKFSYLGKSESSFTVENNILILDNFNYTLFCSLVSFVRKFGFFVPYEKKTINIRIHRLTLEQYPYLSELFNKLATYYYNSASISKLFIFLLNYCSLIKHLVGTWKKKKNSSGLFFIFFFLSKVYCTLTAKLFKKLSNCFKKPLFFITLLDRQKVLGVVSRYRFVILKKNKKNFPLKLKRRLSFRRHFNLPVLRRVVFSIKDYGILKKLQKLYDFSRMALLFYKNRYFSGIIGIYNKFRANLLYYYTKFFLPISALDFSSSDITFFREYGSIWISEYIASVSSRFGVDFFDRNLYSSSTGLFKLEPQTLNGIVSHLPLSLGARWFLEKKYTKFKHRVSIFLITGGEKFLLNKENSFFFFDYTEVFLKFLNRKIVFGYISENFNSNSNYNLGNELFYDFIEPTSIRSLQFKSKKLFSKSGLANGQYLSLINFFLESESSVSGSFFENFGILSFLKNSYFLESSDFSFFKYLRRCVRLSAATSKSWVNISTIGSNFDEKVLGQINDFFLEYGGYGGLLDSGEGVSRFDISNFIYKVSRFSNLKSVIGFPSLLDMRKVWPKWLTPVSFLTHGFLNFMYDWSHLFIIKIAETWLHRLSIRFNLNTVNFLLSRVFVRDISSFWFNTYCRSGGLFFASFSEFDFKYLSTVEYGIGSKNTIFSEITLYSLLYIKNFWKSWKQSWMAAKFYKRSLFWTTNDTSLAYLEKNKKKKYLVSESVDSYTFRFFFKLIAPSIERLLSGKGILFSNLSVCSWEQLYVSNTESKLFAMFESFGLASQSKYWPMQRGHSHLSLPIFQTYGSRMSIYEGAYSKKYNSYYFFEKVILLLSSGSLSENKPLLYSSSGVSFGGKNSARFFSAVCLDSPHSSRTLEPVNRLATFYAQILAILDVAIAVLSNFFKPSPHLIWFIVFEVIFCFNGSSEVCITFFIFCDRISKIFGFDGFFIKTGLKPLQLFFQYPLTKNQNYLYAGRKTNYVGEYYDGAGLPLNFVEVVHSFKKIKEISLAYTTNSSSLTNVFGFKLHEVFIFKYTRLLFTLLRCLATQTTTPNNYKPRQAPLPESLPLALCVKSSRHSLLVGLLADCEIKPYALNYNSILFFGSVNQNYHHREQKYWNVKLQKQRAFNFLIENDFGTSGLSIALGGSLYKPTKARTFTGSGGFFYKNNQFLNFKPIRTTWTTINKELFYFANAKIFGKKIFFNLTAGVFINFFFNKFNYFGSFLFLCKICFNCSSLLMIGLYSSVKILEILGQIATTFWTKLAYPIFYFLRIKRLTSGLYFIFLKLKKKSNLVQNLFYLLLLRIVSFTRSPYLEFNQTGVECANKKIQFVRFSAPVSVNPRFYRYLANFGRVVKFCGFWGLFLNRVKVRSTLCKFFINFKFGFFMNRVGSVVRLFGRSGCGFSKTQMATNVLFLRPTPTLLNTTGSAVAGNAKFINSSVWAVKVFSRMSTIVKIFDTKYLFKKKMDFLEWFSIVKYRAGSLVFRFYSNSANFCFYRYYFFLRKLLRFSVLRKTNFVKIRSSVILGGGFIFSMSSRPFRDIFLKKILTIPFLKTPVHSRLTHCYNREQHVDFIIDLFFYWFSPRQPVSFSASYYRWLDSVLLKWKEQKVLTSVHKSALAHFTSKPLTGPAALSFNDFFLIIDKRLPISMEDVLYYRDYSSLFIQKLIFFLKIGKITLGGIRSKNMLSVAYFINFKFFNRFYWVNCAQVNKYSVIPAYSFSKNILDSTQNKLSNNTLLKPHHLSDNSDFRQWQPTFGPDTNIGLSEDSLHGKIASAEKSLLVQDQHWASVERFETWTDSSNTSLTSITSFESQSYWSKRQYAKFVLKIFLKRKKSIRHKMTTINSRLNYMRNTSLFGAIQPIPFEIDKKFSIFEDPFDELLFFSESSKFTDHFNHDRYSPVDQYVTDSETPTHRTISGSLDPSTQRTGPRSNVNLTDDSSDYVDLSHELGRVYYDGMRFWGQTPYDFETDQTIEPRSYEYWYYYPVEVYIDEPNYCDWFWSDGGDSTNKLSSTESSESDNSAFEEDDGDFLESNFSNFNENLGGEFTNNLPENFEDKGEPIDFFFEKKKLTKRTQAKRMTKKRRQLRLDYRRIMRIPVPGITLRMRVMHERFRNKRLIKFGVGIPDSEEVELPEHYRIRKQNEELLTKKFRKLPINFDLNRRYPRWAKLRDVKIRRKLRKVVKNRWVVKKVVIRRRRHYRARRGFFFSDEDDKRSTYMDLRRSRVPIRIRNLLWDKTHLLVDSEKFWDIEPKPWDLPITKESMHKSRMEYFADKLRKNQKNAHIDVRGRVEHYNYNLKLAAKAGAKSNRLGRHLKATAKLGQVLKQVGSFMLDMPQKKLGPADPKNKRVRERWGFKPRLGGGLSSKVKVKHKIRKIMGYNRIDYLRFQRKFEASLEKWKNETFLRKLEELSSVKRSVSVRRRNKQQASKLGIKDKMPADVLEPIKSKPITPKVPGFFIINPKELSDFIERRKKKQKISPYRLQQKLFKNIFVLKSRLSELPDDILRMGDLLWVKRKPKLRLFTGPRYSLLGSGAYGEAYSFAMWKRTLLPNHLYLNFVRRHEARIMREIYRKLPALVKIPVKGKFGPIKPVRKMDLNYTKTRVGRENQEIPNIIHKELEDDKMERYRLYFGESIQESYDSTFSLKKKTDGISHYWNLKFLLKNENTLSDFLRSFVEDDEFSKAISVNNNLLFEESRHLEDSRKFSRKKINPKTKDRFFKHTTVVREFANNRRFSVDSLFKNNVEDESLRFGGEWLGIGSDVGYVDGNSKKVESFWLDELPVMRIKRMFRNNYLDVGIQNRNYMTTDNTSYRTKYLINETRYRKEKFGLFLKKSKFVNMHKDSFDFEFIYKTIPFFFKGTWSGSDSGQTVLDYQKYKTSENNPDYKTFNPIFGIFVLNSNRLNRDILRNNWNFGDFNVSDTIGRKLFIFVSDHDNQFFDDRVVVVQNLLLFWLEFFRYIFINRWSLTVSYSSQNLGFSKPGSSKYPLAILHEMYWYKFLVFSRFIKKNLLRSVEARGFSRKGRVSTNNAVLSIFFSAFKLSLVFLEFIRLNTRFLEVNDDLTVRFFSNIYRFSNLRFFSPGFTHVTISDILFARFLSNKLVFCFKKVKNFDVRASVLRYLGANLVNGTNFTTELMWSKNFDQNFKLSLNKKVLYSRVDTLYDKLPNFKTNLSRWVTNNVIIFSKSVFSSSSKKTNSMCSFLKPYQNFSMRNPYEYDSIVVDTETPIKKYIYFASLKPRAFNHSDLYSDTDTNMYLLNNYKSLSSYNPDGIGDTPKSNLFYFDINPISNNWLESTQARVKKLQKNNYNVYRDSARKDSNLRYKRNWFFSNHILSDWVASLSYKGGWVFFSDFEVDRQRSQERSNKHGSPYRLNFNTELWWTRTEVPDYNFRRVDGVGYDKNYGPLDSDGEFSHLLSAFLEVVNVPEGSEILETALPLFERSLQDPEDPALNEDGEFPEFDLNVVYNSEITKRLSFLSNQDGSCVNRKSLDFVSSILNPSSTYSYDKQFVENRGLDSKKIISDVNSQHSYRQSFSFKVGNVDWSSPVGFLNDFGKESSALVSSFYGRVSSVKNNNFAFTFSDNGKLNSLNYFDLGDIIDSLSVKNVHPISNSTESIFSDLIDQKVDEALEYAMLSGISYDNLFTRQGSVSGVGFKSWYFVDFFGEIGTTILENPYGFDYDLLLHKYAPGYWRSILEVDSNWSSAYSPAYPQIHDKVTGISEYLPIWNYDPSVWEVLGYDFETTPLVQSDDSKSLLSSKTASFVQELRWLGSKNLISNRVQISDLGWGGSDLVNGLSPHIPYDFLFASDDDSDFELYSEYFFSNNWEDRVFGNTENKKQYQTSSTDSEEYPQNGFFSDISNINRKHTESVEKRSKAGNRLDRRRNHSNLNKFSELNVKKGFHKDQLSGTDAKNKKLDWRLNYKNIFSENFDNAPFNRNYYTQHFNSRMNDNIYNVLLLSNFTDSDLLQHNDYLVNYFKRKQDVEQYKLSGAVRDDFIDSAIPENSIIFEELGVFEHNSLSYQTPLGLDSNKSKILPEDFWQSMFIYFASKFDDDLDLGFITNQSNLQVKSNRFAYFDNRALLLPDKYVSSWNSYLSNTSEHNIFDSRAFFLRLGSMKIVKNNSNRNNNHTTTNITLFCKQRRLANNKKSSEPEKFYYNRGQVNLEKKRLGSSGTLTVAEARDSFSDFRAILKFCDPLKYIYIRSGPVVSLNHSGTFCRKISKFFYNSEFFINSQTTRYGRAANKQPILKSTLYPVSALRLRSVPGIGRRTTSARITDGQSSGIVRVPGLGESFLPNHLLYKFNSKFLGFKKERTSWKPRYYNTSDGGLSFLRLNFSDYNSIGFNLGTKRAGVGDSSHWSSGTEYITEHFRGVYKNIGGELALDLVGSKNSRFPLGGEVESQHTDEGYKLSVSQNLRSGETVHYGKVEFSTSSGSEFSANLMSEVGGEIDNFYDSKFIGEQNVEMFSYIDWGFNSDKDNLNSDVNFLGSDPFTADMLRDPTTESVYLDIIKYDYSKLLREFPEEVQDWTVSDYYSEVLDKQEISDIPNSTDESELYSIDSSNSISDFYAGSDNNSELGVETLHISDEMSSDFNDFDMYNGSPGKQKKFDVFNDLVRLQQIESHNRPVSRYDRDVVGLTFSGNENNNWFYDHLGTSHFEGFSNSRLMGNDWTDSSHVELEENTREPESFFKQQKYIDAFFFESVLSNTLTLSDNLESSGRVVDVSGLVSAAVDQSLQFRGVLFLKTNYLKNYRGLMLDLGLGHLMF